MALKQMKLYVNKLDIAEKLGIETNEFLVSHIELTDGQDIHFLVTMDENTEINDYYEATDGMSHGTNNMRRQRLKGGW